jgi:hypothetical protein
MATPITKIPLRDLTPAVINNAYGYGTAANNPYGRRSILDMGTKLMINGVVYSPDLTQCFGVINDRNEWAFYNGAVGQSTLPYALIVSRYGDYYYSSTYDGLRPEIDKSWATLTSGKIAAYNKLAKTYDGELTTTPISQLVVNNPSTYTAESYNASGTISGVSSLLHYANVVDNGSALIVANLIAFPSNGNSAIFNSKHDRSSGTFISGSNVQVTTFISKCVADNHIVLLSNGQDFANVYLTDNNAGAITVYHNINNAITSKVLYAGPTTSLLFPPSYAKMNSNTFYSMTLCSTVATSPSRMISYCTVADTAAASTTATCTLSDMTPLVDFGTQTKSGYAINARASSRVVNVNGTNYLVFAVGGVDPTNSAAVGLSTYSMFAYQINATDPTQLTLVAYTKFPTAPSLGYIHTDGSIWTQIGSTVQQYQFTGNSFATGASYTIPSGPITDICFTTAGTIIGIDAVNRYAYNLTVQTANIVDLKFQESSMTYSGSTITAHLVLNVYDGTNARVATNVNLTMTGGTFNNGATTIQVTSSSSGDTILPVTITQPGIVSVVPALV